MSTPHSNPENKYDIFERTAENQLEAAGIWYGALPEYNFGPIPQEFLSSYVAPSILLNHLKNHDFQDTTQAMRDVWLDIDKKANVVLQFSADYYHIDHNEGHKGIIGIENSRFSHSIMPNAIRSILGEHIVLTSQAFAQTITDTPRSDYVALQPFTESALQKARQFEIKP